MISLIQANNYSAEINYLDDNDNPKSVVGYTFNFIVKDKNDCLNSDIKALIDKTVVLADEDAENGVFYLNLLPEDTENLKPNTYIYQFQLSKEDYVYTFEQDDFIVKTNKKKDL